MGTPKDFDAADVHWYSDDIGESLACVVFEGSNHVRAMFVLSANTGQTEPTNFLLMGEPFGRSPFFWEKCVEGE